VNPAVYTSSRIASGRYTIHHLRLIAALIRNGAFESSTARVTAARLRSPLIFEATAVPTVTLGTNGVGGSRLSDRVSRE
jgi:hypothetical protein